MAKEKISISIDEDLLKVLRVKAKKDNRNLSQYIETVLLESVGGTYGS